MSGSLTEAEGCSAPTAPPACVWQKIRVLRPLLAREHVGGAQVVHDQARQPVELRLRVGEGEVLEVERRDRELVDRGGVGRLAGDAVGNPGQARRGDVQERVAEVVVHYAD